MKQSMDNDALPVSLFDNVDLKEEIFEFMMQKAKKYKCHSCEAPAFESL